MEYTKMTIGGVMYAFPESRLMSLLDGALFQQQEDGCRFDSPYGGCLIKDITLNGMIELVQSGSFERLVAILIENGIQKESLPILKV